MALNGDLASVDLAQVFQMLALNQKVGMLSIQGPRTWRALYFDHRGVTLYYNEHTLLDRILAYQVRTGRILEEQVQEAREHANQMGSSVIDTLLAGRFLTEEDLEDAFRRELVEEIYDLFFWNDARFEFFESATSVEGREGVINDRFFFSTDSLIMEAARRIDEWSFIQERVPGPLEVYKSVKNNANVLQVDEAAMSILDLADGKRNVGRLIEITGMSSFQVYKNLAILLDQGLVQEVPSDALVPAARECVSEGRLQDAINLFEKALSMDVGVPDAHTMVAQAYEATQEFELAVHHLKCVAEYHVGNGNMKEAVGILRHVVAKISTDLAARERLVEATVGHSEFKAADFDPVTEGKVLVDLYLEIGEIERVRSILERLLRDNPDDVELKKSLINVHTKVGDTKRVIELYESMAQDLVDQRRPIEAVKYLQKILMIDRTRRDISERIRSLYEMDERRRSRRRSLFVLAILFCLAATIGGVWWFYEQHAREHFERIDVRELKANNDFATAASIYKAFIKAYPLTTVAREAEQELARLEAERQLYEAKLRSIELAAEADLKKTRSLYRMEWQNYETEFGQKRLDAALEALDNVRRLVAKAGKEEDLQWANEKSLEKQRRELTTYISDALALERTAREHMDAGDWRTARNHLLELITKYDMTRVAGSARLPVMLTSKPPGARILMDGKPIVREQNGTRVELVTPAVVFCEHAKESDFELQQAGFRSQRVRIDARKSEEVVVILTVVPDRAVTFADPVQTAPGVSRGQIVVGLRGGKVGLAQLDSSDKAVAVKLPGLDDVVGMPVVGPSHFYFKTNEGNIASHLLADGQRQWLAQLAHPPLFDLVAMDGRVFFADDAGRVLCLDMANGKTLWWKAVGGQVAGTPTVAERIVRVGTRNGLVVLLDASDGSIKASKPMDTGITTPTLLGTVQGQPVLVFGTADGKLRALDEQRGTSLWSMNIGKTVREDEICIVGDSVALMVADDLLRKVRLADGYLEKDYRLPGRRTSGPLSLDHRLFLTTRLETRKGTFVDLLQVLNADNMDLLWEYRSDAPFEGQIATDGGAIYLSTTGNAGGSVLRFK